MFKISEIRELIELLDKTSITELKIENEDNKLKIKKAQPMTNVIAAKETDVIQNVVTTELSSKTVPTPVVAESNNELTANIVEIKSPMVGTFYASPAPDAKPYVSIGDRVTEKDVVCIVEAMKLMNEIEAESRGTIIEICAENGQLVEYGQTLFKLHKE